MLCVGVSLLVLQILEGYFLIDGIAYLEWAMQSKTLLELKYGEVPPNVMYYQIIQVA